MAAVVAEECNVRTVTLVHDDSAHESGYGSSQKYTVNARAAGTLLCNEVQRAIQASETGDWSVSEDGAVVAGGLGRLEGECSLELVVAESSDGPAVDSVGAATPHG